MPDSESTQIRSGKNDKIIQVRRLPATKTIHAHQLGLTLAMLLIILNIFMDAMQGNVLSINLKLFFLILFAYGTYVGGFFLLVAGILAIVSIFAGASLSNEVWPTLFLFSRWYLIAYVAGSIFADLYNFLLLLFISSYDNKTTKISFAYDTSKAFNIIKSPLEHEERAFKALELEDKLKSRRLYDYQLENPPKHPYTIAFIANPILARNLNANNNGNLDQNGDVEFQPDPIMKDQTLFLRTVDRALHSFETNEVLGQPEIWSRVRIITVFEPELRDSQSQDHWLVDGGDLTRIDEQIVTNLLQPQEGMVARSKQIMVDALKKSNLPINSTPEEFIQEVDVIYALSASPSYTRSTAQFTDYPDYKNESLLKSGKGEDFTFDLEPRLFDKPKVKVPKESKKEKKVHEYYATYPGRIALNVLSATQKTFVHEFAHAMSSAINGAIADEYADEFELIRAEKDLEATTKQPFYVNRIERNHDNNGGFVPVPQSFVKYNHIPFYSDLEHPSAEENWYGYFPARPSANLPCTMDSSVGPHRFDKLIKSFMYDRLTTKINRPAKTAIFATR